MSRWLVTAGDTKQALIDFIVGRLESVEVEGFLSNLARQEEQQAKYQAMDLVQ